MSVKIKALSFNEKLKLMEELWDSITSDHNYSPPDWHMSELKEREIELNSGNSEFEDWDEAKEKIRKQVK